MIRGLLALLLLAAAATAHGGQYRPPPRQPPRDPQTPTGGGSPTTPTAAKQALPQPWERWWNYNRDHYLRLRQRVLERTVITGPEKKKRLFDRDALRRNVVAPEMLKALRDTDSTVRAAAAIAIGRLQVGAGIPVLWELHRKDKSRSVRESAIIGLALMRDPTLAAKLRALVLDDSEERRVRGFAVIGLGLLPDRDFLTGVLRGKIKVPGSGAAKNEVRACAAFALGVAGSPTSAGPLARLALDRKQPRGVRGYSAAALGRLNSPLVAPEALSMIKDVDCLAEARCGAAIAVGDLVGPGEHGILDFLGKRAQRDKHGGMRALLFISLGKIGGERAAKHITGELMQTREQTMRGFTALGLGISRTAEAGGELLAEFGRRKNFLERAACALGMGLAGYTDGASAIREHVKKKRVGFMGHGLVALGLLNDKEAAPLAEEILKKSTDPPTLREAATALALLRQGGSVPVLIKLLGETKSGAGRAALAYVLGEIGTEAAAKPLLEIYRDEKRQGTERAAALSALGRIADAAPISIPAQLACNLNPYVASEGVAAFVTVS